MDTNGVSESKQKSKETSSENVDVEMEVNASVVNKPENMSDRDSKTPSPTKKSPKKRKQKSVSPNQSHKKMKKDPDRPEYPKVGYVRFMYVRREELRKNSPDMHHLDVTKKIGEEWMAMSEEKKKPYLDAAKEDKLRYKIEMKEYTKKMQNQAHNGDVGSSKSKKKKVKKEDIASDTSIEVSPKKTKRKPVQNGNSEASDDAKSSAKMRNLTNGNGKSSTKSKPAQSPATATEPRTAISISTPPATPPQFDSAPIYGDVPIFTDQFLEHNRQMESELKKLRKLNTDYEQQNAVLEKHVENVQNGINKTNDEITGIRNENDKLTTYLRMLREKLSHQLRNLSIPNEPHGANMGNIDKYMNDLHGMVKSDSHGPASLNKAKDLIRKVDLNIDLNAFHSIS